MAENFRGDTALIAASEVEINFCPTKFMRSYCLFSFQAGNLDVVKSLLGAGANVDARDKYGLTALHKVELSGCLV